MPRPSLRTDTSAAPPEDRDLLTLVSIDHHPSMAPSLGAKEPLSQALQALEEQIRLKTRNMAFFAKSPNESTASELLGVARTELAPLERERTQLMGELRHANEGIEACREQTREEIRPQLAALALPIIEHRLEDLAILAAVARLLGTKAPARGVRESLLQETSSLEQLRAALTEGR